jgi:hypothetical protein
MLKRIRIAFGIEKWTEANTVRLQSTEKFLNIEVNH